MIFGTERSRVASRAPVGTVEGRRGRPTARTARRGLAVAGVCAAVAGLFACYLRVAATYPVGSDGASNALEAWDLLHGNVLLRGWTLTDVSFYTTELPEYAAVELARGLNAGVVHTAAAITYTLLALAAAALARGRARGAQGWARALIAAGIMVAPQLGNGVHVLLSQPDHVGTQVPLLVTFLLLERGPRRGSTVAAVGALLTLTIVADKIAISEAVVPLVAVSLWYAVRPAERLRARWFELSVGGAAVAATVLAQLSLVGISRLGGFTLLPVETRTVAPSGVPCHLSMTGVDALNLFGADVRAAPPGVQSVVAWLHLPGFALATAAFAIALRRLAGRGLAGRGLAGRRLPAQGLPDRSDLVCDVLAVGLAVAVADFVSSAIPSTPFDTRELVGVLPYGAVLAGRIFGPWVTASSRLVVVALALAGACQLGALGYAATRPAAANPELALAGWLAGHHLTTGLGTYTEDNVTTLDSGGAVRLRTVSWPRSGRAAPRLYQSSASWYDPRAADATFVVSGTADHAGDLIPRADILALAGPPARTYRFRSFTIMVWNANLLALLAAPPSRLPGDIGHARTPAPPPG